MSPVRSVDVRTVAVAAATGLALAGCATTQQEAKRLQLNSARIRVSETPTRVTVAGQSVQVAGVSVVHGPAGAAFVVRVHNPGRRTVSDLPISVGVRVDHRPPRLLNVRSTSEFSYYNAHLPAIDAGQTITWIYSSGARVPVRGRPFAVVGGTPSVAVPDVAHPPLVTASVTGVTAGQVVIAMRNHSTVPQYQFQLYAYAVRGRRYVAAGSLTVPHLGTDTRQTARLALLGDPVNARLQIEAVPTIVR